MSEASPPLSRESTAALLCAPGEVEANRFEGVPQASPARGLVQLLRPKQWIKNGFVLAPVVFAGLYFDAAAVSRALAAVALFSVAASAVYVLNDLLDRERDRTHPVKRHTRPLAAGAVTVPQTVALLGALYLILIGAFAAAPLLAGVTALYVALNVGYSIRLKHVPVVDLFCIAAGFVLRVWAGAVAVSVPLSSWMLITTLSLALFLAAIKRRQELAASGVGARSVLRSYSVPLLDRYAEMSAVSAILFYGLYVVEVRPELAVTIPFVIFGLFRYWFIVESLDGGESPTEALYQDAPLMLTVVGWAVTSILALQIG